MFTTILGETSECRGHAQAGDRAGVRRVAAEAQREAAVPAVSTLDGACVRRAVCQDDLLAAYRFVCQARLDLGYPAPGPEVLWPDPADGPREIATFLAKSWPDVVATATFLLGADGPGLPADRAFPEELDALRRRGRLLAELTNRSTIPACFKTDIPAELVRCSVAQGQFVGCSDLLAVIRPWERAGCEALGFRPIGPARSSGGAVPEPVILVRLDLTWLQAGGTGAEGGKEADWLLWQFHVKANPFARYVRAWADRVDEEVRAGRIGPVEAPAGEAGFWQEGEVLRRAV